MEVILKNDIIGLGEEGEIRKVAPGYARNYLIPQGFAVLNNKANKAILEKQKAEIEARKEKKIQDSLSLEEKLKGIELKIESPAGESEKLFGSITSSNIAAEIEKLGFEIDKRKIILKNPIKMLGSYLVPIRLHEGIIPEIKVTVLKEGELKRLKQEMEKKQAEEALQEQNASEKAATDDNTNNSEENTTEN